MSNEYVLTPLSDLQSMANALKEATGNSGEMSYEDFKGTIVNIKNEIGGGGGENAETVEIQLTTPYDSIRDPNGTLTYTINSYYINSNGEKTEGTHIISYNEMSSITVKKGTIFVLYSPSAFFITSSNPDSVLLYIFDETYAPLSVIEAVSDIEIIVGY